MKSSSTPIFKILSVVVLAAAVVYFAVQAYRYFSDPINTTLVYASVEEQTIEISGYLVREEETFHSDAATLGHSLSEGERVGKNQTMATAYPDSGALTRVEQLEALQLRLEQLSFSLISYLDPDAALKLDSTINSGILTLRQSIAGGEYSGADEEVSALKSAVLKRDFTSSSQEEIEAEIKSTEQSISELESSLNGTAITAPEAGIYSAACDGYESVLTLDFLKDDLTYSKLNSVKPVSSDSANVGKLIYGDTWYYAASITGGAAGWPLHCDGAVCQGADCRPENDHRQHFPQRERAPCPAAAQREIHRPDHADAPSVGHAGAAHLRGAAPAVQRLAGQRGGRDRRVLPPGCAGQIQARQGGLSGRRLRADRGGVRRG